MLVSPLGVEMYIINRKNGTIETLPAKEIPLGCSPLATRVLHALAKKPACPRDLSKQLGEHEQKIYYHIRELEKAGIVKVLRKENRGGIYAKIYALSSPAFFSRFCPFDVVNNLPRAENDFLSPFVSQGKLNAKIVVGSPDPHGPSMARSRDGFYAADLALFLGTYITTAVPCIRLDISMQDAELKENIILIGGPVVNKITKKVNSKMPVRFNEQNNIYSSLTKKTYKSDETGIIVKAANPFARDRKALVVAGKRYSGTRAAILAIIQKFGEISEKPSSVVEGIDEDDDGIVDSVRILE